MAAGETVETAKLPALETTKEPKVPRFLSNLLRKLHWSFGV
jgi:hypothetical protein